MNEKPPFLPYARQTIGEDDISAVVEVLRGDMLTTGPTVEAFEAALSKVTGAKHAICCSSGTAALHLAALALELGPGDKVVVPSITFLATANAARYVGAEVVFADVNPDTGLMDAVHFEQAIEQGGEKIKAVWPVHLAGQSPEMVKIRTMAHARNIIVIEDACHALGSTYPGEGGVATMVGSCADSHMVAFSFHPVKTIAMGEGGAVTTNDDRLAERLRLLRSHGMVRDPDRKEPWVYKMAEMGFNYRASDIHCALGLSQLGKLETFSARRRELVALYDKAMAPLSPVLKPLTRMPGDPVWHLYVALIDFTAAGMDRAELMNKMSQSGVGSQVHYIPVHSQPYYRERYGDGNFPGTGSYYSRCLSLPLFAGMTDEDVGRVVDVVSGLLCT
ncbi:MAG: UDP-4-amino-4,6-dideoxy-N-acetyl-beta-L-altrosamine transaminase [Rhodospirillales bacterium]|nr:UDP-4-amino-4,6-dideoxy-N-acetyl-beta-L-altrosamine transaminase [Rhodospirillales bacterium]